jgi:hypothetical protein
MILGKPKGGQHYTCSLSNKYYENQCKNPPYYYDIFEFVKVSDDYVFIPEIKKYDKLEKMCYLFHHKIVRYYIDHKLDPDIPWWWYEDTALHELATHLAYRILKVKDTQ